MTINIWYCPTSDKFKMIHNGKRYERSDLSALMTLASEIMKHIKLDTTLYNQAA